MEAPSWSSKHQFGNPPKLIPLGSNNGDFMAGIGHAPLKNGSISMKTVEKDILRK